MKTRTIVSLTLLASALALAGCAEAPPPAAASAADYPMLGFASPGASASEPVSPRFEEDRILTKPVVMTDKWAR